MLSRPTIKLIRSLEHKKYRQKHKLFIAEGMKTIESFLSSSKYTIHTLFVTDKTFQISNNRQIKHIIHITPEELQRISLLSEPHFGLALIELKEDSLPIITSHSFIIALDGIRDPGNMGTIIRSCAWFGVQHIVCSEDCVDVFSPKCVQATMGAINYVSVSYVNLAEWLSSLKKSATIYGATLDGKSLSDVKPCLPGVVIIGNESHGISDLILKYINQQITIPHYSHYPINSLNAAIACSIIIWHFKSQQKLFGKNNTKS